jgi:hypothetical protein
MTDDGAANGRPRTTRMIIVGLRAEQVDLGLSGGRKPIRRLWSITRNTRQLYCRHA